MKLVISDEALAALEHQIQYIRSTGRPQSAREQYDRVFTFLTETLLLTPGNGRYIPDADIWETHISGTRLIVWYTFDDQQLRVLNLWHGSQDREREL
ncbi:MAG: type II toxin-antitoxin system RelE/ParE family toxin [Hyphomicrobiaceae bacterium]